MEEENKYISLHEAIENCGEDQAIVDLGVDRGFKIIDEDEW